MGKGGLAFLNKKPWHTASMKNMEIVWKKEQEEKKRQKKLAAQQKQIKEERVIEDLKREQVKAGLISNADCERMEWMYQAPILKPSEKECFLGEKNGGTLSFIKKGEDFLSERSVRPKQGIAAFIINTKEHEKKIREDPVTEISRTMKSRRNEILSNPLKMKRIYDEARLVKDERDNKKALRALIKKKEKLEKKIYGRH